MDSTDPYYLFDKETLRSSLKQLKSELHEAVTLATQQRQQLDEQEVHIQCLLRQAREKGFSYEQLSLE